MTPPIPVEQFGKDHWSTFAYIETRVVDYGGVLANPNMRTDASRHPKFMARNSAQGGAEYPTRLRGEAEQTDHDDWDCLLDAQEAGLLTIMSPRDLGWWNIDRGRRGPLRGPGAPNLSNTIVLKVQVELTPMGEAVAGELRAHKGRGENYATFVPTMTRIVAGVE